MLWAMRLAWPWRRPATEAAHTALGRRGEKLAAATLRRSGYRVLARNLRRRLGEVDLLAEHKRDRTIVIVEVKTTRSDDPPPEVHVNTHKQHKLTMLAGHLMRELRLGDRRVRFDVIAIVWPIDARKPSRVTHHVGAFEAAF
jgi:putative endonuclease